MRKLRWGLFLPAVLLLIGCTVAQIEERNYYLLSYYPHTENPKLFQKTSLEQTVCVEQTTVNRPYDRKQIALRNYGPELQYSSSGNWAENISDAATRLMIQRLQNYRIFSEVHDSGDDVSDLRWTTHINNLELFRNPDTKQAQAHLNIAFVLQDAATGKVIVHYETDAESGMLTYDDYSMFVQQINLMLLNETDRFIVRILQHYGRMTETPVDLSIPIPKEETQLLQDSLATAQKGILFVPALSATDNEPYYSVVDQYGLELDTHPRMGQSILLDPGTYSIRYGSGNPYQKMEKENVEIIPMFRTNVDPDWGCLIVDIVDKDRDYIQMQYNLYDAISWDDYGPAWSVEDEVGEQEKVWVLKPGLYKITINSEPANTYTNFSTVVVEKGKLERLMLVVDTDSEGNPTNLIGSGVSAAMGERATAKAYKFTSAVHSYFDLSSDNNADKNNPTTTYSFNTQLDNRFLWDEYPYYFNSKNLVDLNLSKEQGTDFRFTADKFTWKNTLIYYFIHEIGLYTRADVSSQLFTDRLYTADPMNYLFIDRDSTSTYYAKRDNMKISPAFLPLTLKEGVGVNFRLFNRPSVSFNVRAGFGLRQEYNDKVYTKDVTVTDSLTNEKYDIYRELRNVSSNGIELSAVSNFQLPGNISLSSNLDALVPMEQGENVSYEWENALTIRLIKYISLDYELNLKYNKDVADWTQYDHSLYLRFTYMLY